MVTTDIITWKLEYVNEGPVSLSAKTQKNLVAIIEGH